MPCYDKKLEASRKDFYDEIYATRDVDCVITTGELELLMHEKGFDLSTPSSSSFPSVTTSAPTPNLPELLSHPGSSSGSYLQSIIDVIRRTSPVPLELTTRMIRSGDYEEYILRERVANDGTNNNGSDGGRIVFRGAKCYGFRNLQNVVRKVGRDAGVQVGRGAAGRLGGAGRTRGAGTGGLRARVMRRAGATVGSSSTDDNEKTGYDYVEVMACPSGCVNGGGQIRGGSSSPLTTKTATVTVDEEGYTRDWTQSGAHVDNPAVATTVVNADMVPDKSAAEGVLQNSARWGDKAWTKRVEEAYWRDRNEHEQMFLPTPPDSPPRSPSRNHNEDTNVKGIDHIWAEADRLAAQVLTDLCRPREALLMPTAEGPDSGGWQACMDEEAEARRRRLFRTEYRAVESEVVGLAVKW
jgi:hypothetical protein